MQHEVFDAIGQGIVTVGPDGRITAINLTAGALLGVSREYALGCFVDDVFPGSGLTEALRTGNPAANRKAAAGSLNLTVNSAPIVRGGSVVGAVAVINDLSVLEEMLEELAGVKELKDELEAIFNSSYDEIFVVDGKGTVIRVNSTSESYYGVKAGEITGQSVFDLERRGFFKPSVTRLVLEEKRRVTIVQKTKRGKELIVTGNPVFNDSGEIVRIVVNSRDITELTSLRQKLSETEKLAESYRSQILKLQREKIKNSDIIALSPQMKQLMELLVKIAQVDSTVLITGESGVGKGVVAARIHQLSNRRDGPFISINCGAIPDNLLESELFGYDPGAFTGAKKEGKKGLIQLGHGGTVFLDEVADLPLSLQVKLLHVIHHKSLMPVGGNRQVMVDVRFLAATNRDIEQMVKDGRFREDLFYRLNVIPINIQPLRYRTEDIIPLVEHFLGIFNTKYDMCKRFSPETLGLLRHHNWPGNVREVENIVERLVVTAESPEIQPVHLPDYIVSSDDGRKDQIYVLNLCPLDEAVRQVERQLILKAYERFNNTYHMADALKVNQSTVVRKMKKYLPVVEGRRRKSGKPGAGP